MRMSLGHLWDISVASLWHLCGISVAILYADFMHPGGGVSFFPIPDILSRPSIINNNN